MRVAGVGLAGHGGEGVAQVTPVARKAAGVMAAGPRIVVEGAVVAVTRDAALLLQLHQGLDLMVVGLGVGSTAAAVPAAAVRRPGEVPKIQRGGD